MLEIEVLRMTKGGDAPKCFHCHISEFGVCKGDLAEHRACHFKGSGQAVSSLQVRAGPIRLSHVRQETT